MEKFNFKIEETYDFCTISHSFAMCISGVGTVGHSLVTPLTVSRLTILKLGGGSPIYKITSKVFFVSIIMIIIAEN